MGRKPVGEKKLSITEKQIRYHEKNKENLKEKSWWRTSHYYTRKSGNKSQKEEKKGDKKMQQTATLMRNHWLWMRNFLHFLEVWNELKVA